MIKFCVFFFLYIYFKRCRYLNVSHDLFTFRAITCPDKKVLTSRVHLQVTDVHISKSSQEFALVTVLIYQFCQGIQEECTFFRIIFFIFCVYIVNNLIEAIVLKNDFFHKHHFLIFIARSVKAACNLDTGLINVVLKTCKPIVISPYRRVNQCVQKTLIIPRHINDLKSLLISHHYTI